MTIQGSEYWEAPSVKVHRGCIKVIVETGVVGKKHIDNMAKEESQGGPLEIPEFKVKWRKS